MTILFIIKKKLQKDINVEYFMWRKYNDKICVIYVLPI